MAWRFLLALALVVGATAADTRNLNACQGCRKIVSFVQRYNATHSREAATDLFRNFCEQYYPPSTDFQQGPCSMFINGLFSVIDHTDPITHCDKIGVCGPKQPSDDIYDYMKSSNSLEGAEYETNDDTMCQFCHDLVEQFKAVFTTDDGLDRIRNNAEEFCYYLRVIDREEDCKMAISDYLDTVALLLPTIDTHDYCVSLTQCKAERRIRATGGSSTKQLPTLADFNNFGIETSVAIGPKPTSLTASAATSIKKGPECALCKTIVKELFHFLRDNRTEANIIQGLDRVCKLVYPSEPNLGQCKSMVKAYTRELVQLLVDETDPEMICMLLEQCAYHKDSTPPQRNRPELTQISTTKPEALQPAYDLGQLITSLDPSIRVKSARSCIECKMFIRYLKDKLNNPKSQAELKQWLLENLCQELPEKSLVDSCSSMVESYSDIFFKAIAGDLNPTTACIELRVCSPSMIPTAFLIGNANQPAPSFAEIAKKKSAEERRCNRCKDVVAFIDDHLGAHPMSEVLATVSKVCDNTNNSMRRGDNTDNSLSRSECMSMVKQYGTDMIQLIPTMESPRHLCKQIALC